MRAISFFTLDAGTSTFACLAWQAFRMRVSISAIGSVIYFLPDTPRFRLPTRFGNAWNFPLERQVPEANPAEAEPAYIAARPAAPTASVVGAGFKFRRSFCLSNQ
jgi:hypothetical protein